MAIGYGTAQPKPEPRKKAKARKLRLHRMHVHDIRDYVFMRERNICRCCRAREAHSMHEMKPRSIGGQYSRKNSIAVCGTGTTMCHGFLQQHKIEWETNPMVGAEGFIVFTPKTQLAADHMKVKLGESIVSPPMRDYVVDAE